MCWRRKIWILHDNVTRHFNLIMKCTFEARGQRRPEQDSVRLHPEGRWTTRHNVRQCLRATKLALSLSNCHLFVCSRSTRKSMTPAAGHHDYAEVMDGTAPSRFIDLFPVFTLAYRSVCACPRVVPVCPADGWHWQVRLDQASQMVVEGTDASRQGKEVRCTASRP